MTALKILEARIALAKQDRRKDDASIKLVKSSLWDIHFNPYIAAVRDYLNSLHYKDKTVETNLIIARLAFFDEQLLHELQDDLNGTLQQVKGPYLWLFGAQCLFFI
jgi:UTP:GlnB (protein PII) uridylyltransferase